MRLGKKFISVLNDEHCQSALIDNADAIVNYLIEDDALSAIPLVGNIISGGKAVLAYRDRKLIKKISVFLNQLETVSQDEISVFLSKLEDEEYREAIGEKLLTLLDRADDDEKAKVLGELFKRYIRGEINKENFELLSHAIDRVFFFDLHLLRHSHHNQYTMKDLGPLFIPFRIVKLDIRYIKHDPSAFMGETVAPDHIRQEYELTSLGQKLVSVLNQLYG